MAKPVTNFRRARDSAVALLPGALIVMCMVTPLVMWSCFVMSRDELLINPHEIFWDTFPRSALLAASSALMALFAGAAVSLLYVFSESLTQRAITAMMLIPLLVGYLARNYAWLGLLTTLSNSHSVIPLAAIGNGLLYNGFGIVVVTGTVFIPIAFFLTLQGFSSVSVEAIQSSRSLGCSEWKSISAVVLPLVRRQCLVAWGLCFVLALGYFITPRMIGGGNHNFVGNEVIRILRDPGDTISASWLALDLLFASAGPIVLIVYYSARRRRELTGE